MKIYGTQGLEQREERNLANRTMSYLIGVILGLLLSTAAGWTVSAAPGLSLSWWMIGSGGGQSSGGAYQLEVHIGQSVAGETMRGGEFGVTGSFGTIPLNTPTAPIAAIYMPHLLSQPLLGYAFTIRHGRARVSATAVCVACVGRLVASGSPLRVVAEDDGSLFGATGGNELAK